MTDDQQVLRGQSASPPLSFSDFARLKEYGANVAIPEDAAERHRVALEVICSRGVPCYLTPYGAVRSVAAFALGATDDAFYTDGEVLLKAAMRARTDGVDLGAQGQTNEASDG